MHWIHFHISSLSHEIKLFSSPTGYCNKLQLHLYQGRRMYPLRYVFSSSFPVRICRLPDITKRAPDHPQKGRCCRGGCDSHPQPESKQDCVISVTSCPTNHGSQKSKGLEVLTQTLMWKEHQCLPRDLWVVVWFGPIESVTFFTTLAYLANLPSGPLSSPTGPYLLYQKSYFWLQCADWVFTWHRYQYNFLCWNLKIPEENEFSESPSFNYNRKTAYVTMKIQQIKILIKCYLEII